MNPKIFYKEYPSSERQFSLTFNEWVDQNIFLIHESKFSDNAKKELANQIYTRCESTLGDSYKIKTKLGDVVELGKHKRGHYLLLKINKKVIYPKYNYNDLP